MAATFSINKESYVKMHPSRSWPTPPSKMTFDAIADTGAQMCTAGPDFLSQLAGATHWLLATTQRLRGVGNNVLDITGALMVDIQCKSGKTTEPIFICNDVKGIYLSLNALKNLNIIKRDFPSCPNQMLVGDAKLVATVSPVAPSERAPCGCPLRSPCPSPPKQIPFPATPEYRKHIEDWIKERYASSAFNVCPHQKLQTMKGEPLRITFVNDYTPFAAHKPIPVPHHWKEEVKRKLDADVALGIIEPVPQNTPTKWCARMVIVPKKDGTPRRTVDLQNLNKVTHRETHHTPSPFNIVSVVPPKKKKTVLDAWNGYHSVLLSPEARNATTFITEWGRYRYLRAPQGFHASSDGYTKRFDDITAGFPRLTRCVDDSLLWDNDIATSFWHTLSYIQLCGDSGIVFNPEKFRFAEDSVEFAGFEMTPTGYQPPQRLLKAIEDFPSPTNITGVRSWFGLVNHISFAFAQAPIMAPFRELLTKRQPFYWDTSLETLFQNSKAEIIRSIKNGVTTFEVNRPTCLATDWSRTGIGFTLSQKHCDCPDLDNPFCGGDHWRVTYAGSRFTRNAESRYAPIEGEALALLFGLESCRMFVLGCPKLIVAVDHKPLVQIFNERDLDKISNPRLLKIRERALAYRFKVIAIPGKKNCGPDAVSRIPTPPPVNAAVELTDGIEAAIIAEVSLLQTHNHFPHSLIQEHAKTDHQYNSLLSMLANGFPTNQSNVPVELKEFWPLREDLYVVDGMIFSSGKPLIPQGLRRHLLEELHIGHQGVNTMKANARRRFFWPGMHRQIQQIRDHCHRCDEIAPSQCKETLMRGPNPEYPFQQAVADLCQIAGKTFFIYADRYSGWTEIHNSEHTNTMAICNILRRYFSTFGVPEELSTDGGPPFSSYEFKMFLQRWGIQHRISSAHYAQSNGRAESAVKCMKRTLTTNLSPSGSLDRDAVAKALLLHRNTPPPDMGVSPAELLFGRSINDHMPQPIRLRSSWRKAADQRESAHAKRYSYAAKTRNQKELRPLQTGDTVAIQNQRGNKPSQWSSTGRVVECLPNRQYEVMIDGSRRSTLRNRRFLRTVDSTTRNIPLDEDIFTPNDTTRIAPADKGVITPAFGQKDICTEPEPSPTEATEGNLPAPENQRVGAPPQATEEAKTPTEQHLRRPTRVRRPPGRLRDYIMT